MELSVMTVFDPIGPLGWPPKRPATLQCKRGLNSKKKESSPHSRFVAILTARVCAR